MADSQYISVSGLPTYEELKEQTVFPSGIFNAHVEAYLSSFSASFGFGTSPHKFDLEYIPSSFSFNALPAIGSGVSFTIGDFYISGRIKHADYSRSTNGKVLSITVEDIREDLADYFVDTYGVFGTYDSPSAGMIDVRYWYIQTYVRTRLYGRSRIISDLDMLDTNGASYRQIYDAVSYFENTVGTVSNLLAKLPDPAVVEAQLPGDPDAYRWKFRSQPLIQVINKICDDISYDWYWNMYEQKVNVINRKYAININENDIPVPGDTNPTRSVRYGKDEGERATNVKLLGAQMEGLVGSGTLKTQSGAYELSAAAYDMGIQVGQLRFVPGWKATLKYYGPDGWLNEYQPTDKELAMAMKGMEFWCMEVGIENRLDNKTYDAGDGITWPQRSWSASGIGIIDNRRKAENLWVIEWYNRVRTHAQNHYGRTYVLATNSLLYNYIDELEVVPAAWCNMENLTNDGAFNDNYKIKDIYKWLAIFWEPKANKMHGWARLPSTTKWGFDGEGTPGSKFNDSETSTYVPIEVKKWDKSQKKFDEEYLEALATQEQGIMIRLPSIAWDISQQYIYKESLNRIDILKDLFAVTQRDTTIDIADPYMLPIPFSEITDVAIPIKVQRRYGYSYPTVWASGTGTAREVVVQDSYAPWNYEPRGTKTSTQLMNEDARSFLAGRIVNRNQVTFAEIQKLNLPVISFDGFANQGLTPSGYGIVKHGVTSLNITKNTEWFQTKYSIKSHYPEFVKAKPVYAGLGEDFDFMLKRLQEDERLIPEIPDFEVPDYFNPETPDNRKTIKQDDGLEQKLERYVTIQRVYDRGENEYYLGRDSNGIQWPRSLAVGFGSSADKKAYCIDGFLQVGMKAVYHMETLTDGSVLQYFTGGIALETGRIVELVTEPTLVESIYYSNVRTLPTVVTGPTGTQEAVTPFYFYNVPYLSQQAVDTSLQAGDKIMLSGHGNKKTLVPGGDYVSGGSRDGDAYLVNTGTPSSTMFGYVSTKPNSSTGRSGAIRTYDPSGGTIYADGATVGGLVYNVYFVGCEAAQVQLNDPCVISSARESSGEIRLYCFIMKPTFASGGTFV